MTGVNLINKEEVSQWSDQELDEEVTRVLILTGEIGSKNVSEEDQIIYNLCREEFWKRQEIKADIECVICTNNEISFYDILKMFCSDMGLIFRNICEKHKDLFYIKRDQFLEKKKL